MSSTAAQEAQRSFDTAVWLPRGAVLFSAVVLQCRMLGKLRPAAEAAIYGYERRSTNLFGAHAASVAERLFDNKFTPREVLARHSLFGPYRHFLSEAREAELAERLADGDALAYREYFLARSLTGPSTGALRCCTACVEEDLSDRGFPVWYSVHQIPFLVHCPRHARALVWTCHQCGQPFQAGLSSSLAGDRCWRCKAVANSRPINLSEGEAALGACCIELCDADGFCFRPTVWAAIVDAAVEVLGGRVEAAQAIERAISGRWAVPSIAALRHLFPGDLPNEFVQQELGSLAGAYEIAPRLMVGDALNGLLGADQFARLVANVRDAAGASSSPTAAVEQRAASSGIPIGAVRLLADGHSVRRVSSLANVGFAKLRRFVIQLSRDCEGVAETFSTKNDVVAFIVEGLSEPRRLRRSARRAVEDAIAEGQSLHRGSPGHLFNQIEWLVKHDGAWLNEVLPHRDDLTPRADEFKRESFRAEVIKARQGLPHMPLSDRERRTWPAARWLHEHDRDWYNEQFPPQRRQKYRNDAHKRMAFRKVVLDFLKEHADASRSDLQAALGGAWNWLVRHDRAWTLGKVASRQHRR